MTCHLGTVDVTNIAELANVTNMPRTMSTDQKAASKKNLVMFEKGSDRAREAGRKGGRARAAKHATARVNTSALAVQLTQLQTSFKREALGPAAAALCVALIVRVELGEIKVEGKDLPALLQVLLDITRLEAGEATSQSVVAHISSSDAIARLKVLRETQLGDEVETEIVEL